MGYGMCDVRFLKKVLIAYPTSHIGHLPLIDK
jgi:hypothetical protein